MKRLKLMDKNSFILKIFLVVLVSSIILSCYHLVGNIPFYLDDYSSIVYNPLMQTPVDFSQFWQTNKARFIPYSFFAFQNHWFSGQAYGFHYVSLILHLICTLLLALFTMQVAKIKGNKNLLLLFMSTALLYGLLPQNSQAAIYVVQQPALFAAIFYIAVLLCYCQLRLATSVKLKLAWALALIVGFIAALFSKQNVATLPLAILLLEWVFFGGWLRLLLKSAVMVFILGVATTLYLANFNAIKTLHLLDTLSRETDQISRIDYFRSQLGIIFHYMVQYFYPTSLHLEYDWRVITQWNMLAIAYAIFHLAVIATAIKIRKKLPLVTFGLLFYYLAHLIESSFFPIKDIVFEHRTYLPNLGLTMAIIGLIFYFITNKRTLLAVLTLITILTYKITANRVIQWVSPHRFYQNEVKLSPKNPRSFAALAGTLVNQGNCPLALGYFDHALALYRLDAKSNLGVQPETLQNYITCLRKLHIYAKADFYENTLLKQVHEPIHRSVILLQKGTFLIEQRQFKKGEIALVEAFGLNNKNYAITINLAIVKLELHEFKQAIALLRHALIIKPNDQTAQKLLQRIMVLEHQQK